MRRGASGGSNVEMVDSAGTLVLRPGRHGLALSGLQRVALLLVAVGLLTGSAWISVPFYPVPLTMQTLAVLLIGGLLGPTMGASAVAAYLALGVAGAPVFHNGLAGPAVVAGPTGGYLIGFIAAAFFMGLAVKWAGRMGSGAVQGRDHGEEVSDAREVSLTGWTSLLILILGAVAASVAIYAIGIPWLAMFTGGGLRTTLSVGVVPFLLGDLLKGAVAIGVLRLGGGLLGRRGLLLP
jgi:biotin transport system substrate-specific component